MPIRHVLLVDDERLIRGSLSERLRADGCDVAQASSMADALQALGTTPDAVILDERLLDSDGLVLLKACRRIDPDLPVIMLTPNRGREAIAAVIKASATDHVVRPVEASDVSLRLARAFEAARSARELRRLKGDMARPCTFESIIGESEPMGRVKTLARRIADSLGATVLITGDRGTGKDLLASVIHYTSRRADRPVMHIMCAGRPDALLESELFGHERGAFAGAPQPQRGLFEQADEGTIVLDEIGEMPPALQAKLLRVLEERAFRRLGGSVDVRVDVRLIAMTHRALDDQVRQGRFLEDLYYRLNVLHVEMPPLRDRGRDVVLLAAHYVRTFSREFRRTVSGVSPAAQAALLEYAWPGNVRELRNLIERAVLLAESDQLDLADVNPRDAVRVPHPAAAIPGLELPPDGLNIADVEKQLVGLALERTDGNQTRAAALLGLNRDQIRSRMEKYGLMKPGPATE